MYIYMYIYPLAVKLTSFENMWASIRMRRNMTRRKRERRREREKERERERNSEKDHEGDIIYI